MCLVDGFSGWLVGWWLVGWLVGWLAGFVDLCVFSVLACLLIVLGLKAFSVCSHACCVAGWALSRLPCIGGSFLRWLVECSLGICPLSGSLEACLLDPGRCPSAFKKIMIQEVNKSESFEECGLSLQILNLAEFWCKETFLSTSHTQWLGLGTTTEESCIETATVFFARRKAGKAGNAPGYQQLAKRTAVYCALKNTSYLRFGLPAKARNVLMSAV
jgi:hypothetical protein